MILVIDVVCSLLPPLNQKGHSSIAYLPCTSIRPHAENLLAIPPPSLTFTQPLGEPTIVLQFLLSLFAVTPLVPGFLLLITLEFSLSLLYLFSLTRHMHHRNHRVYTCIYS